METETIKVLFYIALAIASFSMCIYLIYDSCKLKQTKGNSLISDEGVELLSTKDGREKLNRFFDKYKELGYWDTTIFIPNEKIEDLTNNQLMQQFKAYKSGIEEINAELLRRDKEIQMHHRNKYN